MGVGRLAAPPRFLDLLLLDLRPRLDDLVLARGRDASLLELLDHSLLVRDLDLLPDLTELLVEVLHERRIIGPDHLGMIVLLVPCHEQLALLLQLVDRLLDVRPALAKLTDTHARRGGLGLQLLEELLRGADVVWRAEAERALPVGALGVVLDLLVDLEDAPQRMEIPLVVGTVLEGQVRDDIGELERHALGLHVLDREENLGHDVLARAGVGRLRVDNVRIMPFLLDFTAGCGRSRGGRGLRTAGGEVGPGHAAGDGAPLLRQTVGGVNDAGVEVLDLLLKVRHGGCCRGESPTA